MIEFWDEKGISMKIIISLFMVIAIYSTACGGGGGGSGGKDPNIRIEPIELQVCGNGHVEFYVKYHEDGILYCHEELWDNGPGDCSEVVYECDEYDNE